MPTRSASKVTDSECRALSITMDVVRWYEGTSVNLNGARFSHQAASQHNKHAYVNLPPLFDDCTHAMLTALSFATSATVIANSLAADAALSAAAHASATRRRDIDEFDLNSPSPPRNVHMSERDFMQQQIHSQANNAYKLDFVSPSALALHSSQQV
jgi:hypothetical protein